MAAHSDSWPVVARFGSPPLHLKDPQERFERSEWNYFVVDQDAGVLMGCWLAEAGAEDLGADADGFTEVMQVIEGRVYVTRNGETRTAGPGDTILVRPGRPMRLAVRERTRAFFVCYGMSDPQGYEAMVRAGMAEKGL